MKNNKNTYLYALLTLAAGMGILEVLVNLEEQEVSPSTQTLWGLVSIILSIMWAYYDAPTKKFERPFSFGFVVYVFWPVALPIYLVKTRGAEGLVVYLGFLAILIGPWLAGLVAYVYYA